MRGPATTTMRQTVILLLVGSLQIITFFSVVGLKVTSHPLKKRELVYFEGALSSSCLSRN